MLKLEDLHQFDDKFFIYSITFCDKIYLGLGVIIFHKKNYYLLNNEIDIKQDIEGAGKHFKLL